MVESRDLGQRDNNPGWVYLSTQACHHKLGPMDCQFTSGCFSLPLSEMRVTTICVAQAAMGFRGNINQVLHIEGSGQS
jgi:hypothetical protein